MFHVCDFLLLLFCTFLLLLDLFSLFSSSFSFCSRFDALDEPLALEEQEEDQAGSRAGDGVGLRRVHRFRVK